MLYRADGLRCEGCGTEGGETLCRGDNGCECGAAPYCGGATPSCGSDESLCRGGEAPYCGGVEPRCEGGDTLCRGEVYRCGENACGGSGDAGGETLSRARFAGGEALRLTSRGATPFACGSEGSDGGRTEFL